MNTLYLTQTEVQTIKALLNERPDMVLVACPSIKGRGFFMGAQDNVVTCSPETYKRVQATLLTLNQWETSYGKAA